MVVKCTSVKLARNETRQKHLTIPENVVVVVVVVVVIIIIIIIIIIFRLYRLFFLAAH